MIQLSPVVDPSIYETLIKYYSKKFWITFWIIAAIFLAGFYLFLEFKKQPAKTLDSAIDYLPFGLDKKQEFKAIAYFANYLLKKDDKEKVKKEEIHYTHITIFQNQLIYLRFLK